MTAIVSNITPSSCSGRALGHVRCNGSAVLKALLFPERIAERERHGAVDYALAVDARHAFEQPHSGAQPHDVRFDDDDVAGIDGTAIAHALDAGEERNALAVLGFCEHEDRTYLRDGFGPNRPR